MPDKNDAKASKQSADLVKSEALTKDKDSPQFARLITVEWEGREYQVRSDAHLDMRITESIAAMQRGDEPNPAKPLQILLGGRQYRELMEALADTSGDPDEPGYGFVKFTDPDDEDAGVMGCFRTIMRTLDPTAELPA